MSLLSDILKEIPLSAVLKERIASIETENAQLKTEIAILKDDLREARKENERLKAKNERLSQTPEALGEEKDRILKVLSQHSAIYLDELKSTLGMDLVHLEYHLDELASNDYVTKRRSSLIRPMVYSLTQKGRKYLIEGGQV